VTGVQTCALPIFPTDLAAAASNGKRTFGYTSGCNEGEGKKHHDRDQFTPTLLVALIGLDLGTTLAAFVILKRLASAASRPLAELGDLVDVVSEALAS